jgi:ribosomal protein L11 methyltransferase
VLVDDLLFIRAPFHEKNLSFKHEIVIMPKMSFGTGHHQTTRLVCKEMFSVDFYNKRVLDMGCGTGILAILSKKLGAKEVIGIDIDEWSVENSVENCSVNKFPEIQIKLGNVDLLKNEFHFDIILANINKNILKKDIQYYSEKLVPKGRIFLSGFFTTDINEIKDVANINNLNFILSTNENEWAMMVFEKD